MHETYCQARDAYLASALVFRKFQTKDSYTRAIDLFIEYAPKPLAALDAGDADLLVRFGPWLLDYQHKHGDGYAPASALQYLREVRAWFRWMHHNGCLPAPFPFEAAIYNLDEGLRDTLFQADQRPPEPPDMTQIVQYYDRPYVPPDVIDPDLARRWLLTSFRNRALMHCLADSGGRISEVLSLDVGCFPTQAFVRGVWRVEVKGKAGRKYCLWFWDALKAVEFYLEARRKHGGEELHDDDPLFVNFLRYRGQRMSRSAAGHLVADAGHALGMGKVSLHDFRHWRISDLRNRGVPLEDISYVVGHRSTRTTQRHYAHVDPERVAKMLKKL
ncbi:MAG: site-specific integrase [Anaerolineae bacterium]|nr:site-specific integrase [Anaerolineae bacterium]